MIRFDPVSPRGIVWLASYPKSGNTWLRIFLYHLVRLQRGLPREEDEINSYQRVTHWEGQQARVFERHLHKPLAGASLSDVMRVRSAVHAEIAAAAKSIVMLKTHNVLGTFEGSPTVNAAATAGAIYLVRDPRDVAVSLACQRSEPIERTIPFMNRRGATTPSGHPAMAAEIWGSWSENVDSWLAHTDETILAVRYEDMLAKPNETFAAIAAHIRFAATPDQIAEAIARSSFAELQTQEKKHGFHDQAPNSGAFFSSGKAGRWRGKLTPMQVAAIISAHGETMRKFGYLD
jgi:hypothetical protein